MRALRLRLPPCVRSLASGRLEVGLSLSHGLGPHTTFRWRLAADFLASHSSHPQLGNPLRTLAVPYSQARATRSAVRSLFAGYITSAGTFLRLTGYGGKDGLD